MSTAGRSRGWSVRDDLIAAVENEPDDVDSYRVYADWLASNGQPRGLVRDLE